MFKMNYVFIIIAVFVIACGQIIFKYAAQSLRIKAGQSYIDLLLDNIFPIALVLLALALYVMSTVAWIHALRTTPLSIAFMFNSLAFILVPVGAFLLFGEQVPRFFLPGLMMIIGGIFLILR